MFFNRGFRRSTWRVDAISIWVGGIGAAVGWIAGMVEGLGMAISLLIAAGILPLAFMATVLVLKRRQIVEALEGLFRPSEERIPQPLEYMYDPQDEAPTLEAYYDIMAFSLNVLLPACDALYELQRRLIEKLSPNPKIFALSIDGLQHPEKLELHNFWENYNKIWRGIDSSEPTIRFSALIECIRGLERNSYRAFCEQLDEIADASGLDYRTDSDLHPLWEQWRQLHNALVREYDKVKRDVRFEKLFFPRREGRWGGIIPEEASPRLAAPSGIPSLPDTQAEKQP